MRKRLGCLSKGCESWWCRCSLPSYTFTFQLPLDGENWGCAIANQRSKQGSGSNMLEAFLMSAKLIIDILHKDERTVRKVFCNYDFFFCITFITLCKNWCHYCNCFLSSSAEWSWKCYKKGFPPLADKYIRPPYCTSYRNLVLFENIRWCPRILGQSNSIGDYVPSR